MESNCTNSSAEFWPSQSAITILVVSDLFIAVVYGMLLLYAVWNIYWYLVKGGRYKILLLTAFYVIIIPLCVFRIASEVIFSIYFKDSAFDLIYISNQCDTISTYLKAILGVQQFMSMRELSIQIETQKLMTHFPTVYNPATQKRKMRRTMSWSCVLGFLFFCVMIFEVYACKKKDFDCGRLENKEIRYQYGITTGIVFLIDSLILLVSTGLLIRTLKRDFANRLVEEAKSLDLMFKIFTVSYLIRTFMLTMQGWWPSLLGLLTESK